MYAPILFFNVIGYSLFTTYSYNYYYLLAVTITKRKETLGYACSTFQDFLLVNSHYTLFLVCFWFCMEKLGLFSARLVLSLPLTVLE